MNFKTQSITVCFFRLCVSRHYVKNSFMLAIEIITQLNRYMSMMQPTPGCFFACWNIVLIIFYSPETRSRWKLNHVKATSKLKSRSDKCIHVNECLLAEVECWPGQQNLLPISPLGSVPLPPCVPLSVPPIGRMRGSEGRGGQGEERVRQS